MAEPNKPRFKLDSTSWKKIGKGCLIAAAGGILTYLESLAGVPEFGGIGIVIQFAVNAGLVNLARKFLAEY
jgi:hypothetical protein